MPEPTAALQTLRASTADLILGLREESWSDSDVAASSLCEGWTRGHVLTHIARNADGIGATLSGANVSLTANSVLMASTTGVFDGTSHSVIGP